MKQVIVVNDALLLPPGKLAVQVAHAAIAAFLETDNEVRMEWLRCGMPKIALKCPSHLKLTELQSSADAIPISSYLVRDAGKTILTEGTLTCLGLGPAPTVDIDRLTRGFALV